jgi:hypothetical protein
VDKKKTVLVLQVVVHRGVLVGGGGGYEWCRLPGYDIRLRNRYFK